MRRIRGLLDKRLSFAVETTLSGRSHLQFARRAKSSRWKVGLVFIGLRSPRLAVERVRWRRRQGGHNVPDTDIRRRYKRSLANLPIAFRLADCALVLDNSSASERNRMKVVIEKRGRKIVIRTSTLPAWLRGAMASHLRRSHC